MDHYSIKGGIGTDRDTEGQEQEQGRDQSDGVGC